VALVAAGETVVATVPPPGCTVAPVAGPVWVGIGVGVAGAGWVTTIVTKGIWNTSTSATMRHTGW
jgi:hypothetical protein